MSDLHTAEHAAPRTSALRRGVAWLATFLGFPLGGLVAELAGPVDGPVPALLGGLVTGAVLGAVQALGLRVGRAPVPVLAWVVATGAGLAVGLLLGAGAVGYGVGLPALAIQVAVCGAVVGLAQAAILWRRLGALAAAWPPVLAVAWALGWTVTTLVGVDVERGYTVFGSSGALLVAVLTLVLPLVLGRRAEMS
ncbi:hypothetical protein EV188_101174 [Actinomycetospora succinea]|uniref:Uncharacterized protein n=1 Tax=Actinomycetospora succinea TaxID=663603 RepID=A0A4R6VWQ1_9PSEU|nr:hypothetical protein [Actinomycetospora succinea]TDQ64925.1 hypothetical protein EV188_101174 [Actinomycetospora succinea]